MSEPIGLSTSWNGPGRSAEILVEEARSLGFRRIEAYSHFTADGLRALAERDIEIASLHGPCPAPSPGVGDWLASTSDSERTRSVDAHKRSVDAAVEVGARAIVIHLGNAGVISRQQAMLNAIAQYGRFSPQHSEMLNQARRERQSAHPGHFEAALRSMRELGEHALGTGVRLGVEIRDGYHEIPALDEVAGVLAACDGLPVGYWHDAGHGAKQEYLGFFGHEEWLERYADRLVGMHIHDTHLGRDHLAPGQGETDFAMLARYLARQPEAIRTLELHRIVTAREISDGLELLAGFEAFGVREGILIEI